VGDHRARATRDIDLLGRGSLTTADVESMIRDSMAANVVDDGMVFDPTTLDVTTIRERERYGGLRATFIGHLGRARIKMQVDIGLGDAITPGVVDITYPTLLDLPAPALKAYPIETTLAEKLEAIVDLGLANSRMKDYFDIWTLLGAHELDGATIVAAVRATFERRLRSSEPPALADVVERIAAFATSVFDGSAATLRWTAAGLPRDAVWSTSPR
jgi:hypothetical protein